MASLHQPKSSKGLFFALWMGCILGAWCLLPYVQHLAIGSNSISFAKIFLMATAQAVIFFGIVCWLSYLLVPRTDLSPFAADRPFRRIIYPGVLSGIAVGLVIVLLNATLFKSSLLAIIHPPAWMGLLASFYGGINEEVLLRLFFFTFLYFLFRKVFRFEARNRILFLWLTNIVTALVFGLGHLPALFKLVTPSSLEIVRVLLLNGIPGLVFGWLYWSRGLWTAMTAHFVTDIIIHVFLT